MAISPADLRRMIRHVLHDIRLYSPSAVSLLVGTAMVESAGGTYLYQRGNGPARGIYQMEPETERDIWDNYLRYRDSLRVRLYRATQRRGPGPWLTWDLAYQTAMCRIHYLRVPAPLPPADDINAQAAYWKKYYNTNLGAGTTSAYLYAASQVIPA